jgi:hypothetical protein
MCSLVSIIQCEYDSTMLQCQRAFCCDCSPSPPSPPPPVPMPPPPPFPPTPPSCAWAVPGAGGGCFVHCWGWCHHWRRHGVYCAFQCCSRSASQLVPIVQARGCSWRHSTVLVTHCDVWHAVPQPLSGFARSIDKLDPPFAGVRAYNQTFFCDGELLRCGGVHEALLPGDKCRWLCHL